MVKTHRFVARDQAGRNVTILLRKRVCPRTMIEGKLEEFAIAFDAQRGKNHQFT